ncbi:protein DETOXIFICATION 50 [Capsella rubella]|nr:protein DETOXIFICATION 50 [Capsella rubella]
MDEDEEIYEETNEDSVREWKKLLSLAIPNCFSVFLEWWYYEIEILLCCFLSDSQACTASMGIIIKITALVYIFHHSLSLGVSIRVGNELGSNHPQNAKRVAFAGFVLSIILGVIALTFILCIREKWATYFTDDEVIIKMIVKALPIVGFCEFVNSLQTMGSGILKGSARPMIRVIIIGVTFYGIGLPVGLILVFWFKFGIEGFWIGMFAAQVTCLIGMIVVIYKTDWDLEATRARERTIAVSNGNNNNAEGVEAGLFDEVVVD